jgi:hypothetical protein
MVKKSRRFNNGLFQDNGGNTGLLSEFTVSNASMGRYRPQARLGGYQLRDIHADNHYVMAGGSAAGGGGQEALACLSIDGDFREKYRNDAD